MSHGDHTAAAASQGVPLGEPRVLGIQKVPVTSMEKGAFCSQPRTPPKKAHAAARLLVARKGT